MFIVWYLFLVFIFGIYFKLHSIISFFELVQEAREKRGLHVVIFVTPFHLLLGCLFVSNITFVSVIWKC